MLTHVGFRPLWPIMLFAPWLMLGLAYLLGALHKPSSPTSRTAR